MSHRTLIALDFGAAYATLVELLARHSGELIQLGSPPLADALLVLVGASVTWVVLGPRAGDRPPAPAEKDQAAEPGEPRLASRRDP